MPSNLASEIKFTWELNSTQLLNYYLENQSHLEPWDPPKPTGFETITFWDGMLKHYREEHLKYRQIRFALIEKEKVRGLFSFSQIFRGPFQNVIAGYSIHHEWQGKGKAKETLLRAVNYVFDTHNLHRIEANVKTTNVRSSKLLEKAGFTKIGIAPKYLFIGGEWSDHELNQLVNSNWSDVQISLATKEDAKGIANVHVKSWIETYSGIVPQDYLNELDLTGREKRENLWQRILSESQSVLVAKTQSGEVVGFSHVEKSRDQDLASDFGEVTAIYLLKKYHHRGIGKRLFQLSLERLMLMGFQKAMVWVLKENQSVNFYQKMGGLSEKETLEEIGGKELKEARFLWNSIKLSLDI